MITTMTPTIMLTWFPRISCRLLCSRCSLIIYQPKDRSLSLGSPVLVTTLTQHLANKNAKAGASIRSPVWPVDGQYLTMTHTAWTMPGI